MFAISATTRGEDVVDSGISVAELIRPRLDNSANINVNGQTVQFNQGNHVTMNQIGEIATPPELQKILKFLKTEGQEVVADEVVKVHRESGMPKAIAYLLQKITDPALTHLGAQIIPMASAALGALQ